MNLFAFTPLPEALQNSPLCRGASARMSCLRFSSWVSRFTATLLLTGCQTREVGRDWCGASDSFPTAFGAMPQRTNQSKASLRRMDEEISQWLILHTFHQVSPVKNTCPQSIQTRKVATRMDAIAIRLLVPSNFLFLVVRPGAPLVVSESSVRSDARSPQWRGHK